MSTASAAKRTADQARWHAEDLKEDEERRQQDDRERALVEKSRQRAAEAEDAAEELKVANFRYVSPRWHQ